MPVSHSDLNYHPAAKLGGERLGKLRRLAPGQPEFRSCDAPSVARPLQLVLVRTTTLVVRIQFGLG